MNDSFYSPNWYRVANLKPKIHAHVKTHRHDYRGLIWYLLEDSTTERNHRFNPAAYQFIGLLDGSRTVDEIVSVMGEKLDDFIPSQEDIIQILGQLNAAELINTDVMADTEELFERQVSQKKQRLQQYFSSPLALKIALWDPDNFLDKHFNKVRYLFSGWACAAWVLLMTYAVIEAMQHWPEIAQHFAINTLATNNLLLITLLYPIIKILHELGHAFSAKLEGGEVHEMGVNFMLFMPIPYVNVSTATHFRNKYKRILVSAAGIIVETFLAASGLLLFLMTEPGLIQDIGFNMFVIGGISSLFFNGNPLLKFDAYYILADAIAIPNLYERSGRYWCYLAQRYLFRISSAISPAYALGESVWLAIYGFLSRAYKLVVLWFIVTFIMDVSLFIGVVIAIWLISLQLGLPIWKAFRFILSSPSLNRKRGQTWAISLGIVSLLITLLGFVPVPSYTLAQGVVWQPDNAQLIAAEDGFAEVPLVDNNQVVEAGTTVLRLADPFLATQKRIATAKVRELQSQYRAYRVSDYSQAGITKEAIRIAESELDYIIEKDQSMWIKADKSGRVLLPEIDDLPGRLIRKGDLLGYIIGDDQALTVRIAVTQDHIGQVRNHVAGISVRFISEPTTSYSATIIRQAPEATNRLPSAALSIRGGGNFIVDPSSSNGRIINEKVFLIDLELTTINKHAPLGTRAYIRIHHGSEPLAIQWYRSIRQAFLRQLNV
jgi:putative peptide zinc metalloprotease protein